MIKCASCGTEATSEEAVFNGKDGALLGPWWFCQKCLEELAKSLQETNKEGKQYELF